MTQDAIQPLSSPPGAIQEVTGSGEISKQQLKIQELKIKFLEYYKELPVQKLAAGWIGRSPDAVQLWMKDDPTFSAQIDEAKAEWAKRTAKQVRSKEWLLERVMKDHFAERKELTGPEGAPIPILGLRPKEDNVPADDGNGEIT